MRCPLCRAAKHAQPKKQLKLEQEAVQRRERSGPTDLEQMMRRLAIPTPLSGRGTGVASLQQRERFSDFAVVADALRRGTQFELSNGALVFDSSRHGCNLNTLRNRLLGANASLLLLQNTDGEKYGVFTGFPWKGPATHPYGTQDAFLFFASSTISGGNARVWRAETSNNVMYSRPDWVAFGGTSDGRSYGLKINSSLSVADLSHSDTFDNPALGTLRITKVRAMAWGLPQNQTVEFGSADGGRAEAAMVLGLGGARAQAARDWFA